MVWLKRILLALIVGFVAIQFVRPAKNIAAPGASNANDITALYADLTKPEVKQLLAVACYDCHSNTTRYPWYAAVQPLAWWLADHVKEGKHELNFSEFGAYSVRQADRRLAETIDQISDGKMPLESYLITHHDARLTPAQSTMLEDWAQSIRDRIAETGTVGPAQPAAGSAK